MTSRFTIHSLTSVSSTQILAHDWIDQRKAKAGDVITATEQTSGYGRRGRVWVSPKGNLYFTLIEELTDPAHLSWVGFAFGLGLFDAVKDVVPADASLRLKWPNDVLLNDGKLSGILIEVSGPHILIGCGINIALQPESDQKTASLAGLTKPEVLLPVILERYDVWRQQALKHGFSALRTSWLSRAIGLNDTVVARLADGQSLVGRFADLDPTGALVLETTEGTRRITAADIFVQKP